MDHYLRKHNFSNKLTLVNVIEASNKYFLKQSTTSILLIKAIIVNLIYSGQGTQRITKIFNPAASTLMTIALVTKVGLSAFHF
eukprot:bmy_08730T0